MNFQAGEKVLCYHGPLIYQAKVLKAEIWTGEDPSEGGFKGPHYFVHYQGWKASWDEWVPEVRVLKLNDENLERQKALITSAQNKTKEKELEREKEKSAGPSGSASGSGGGLHRSDSSRKRPRDSDEKRRGGSTGGGGSSADRNAASSSKRAKDGEEEESLRRPEIKIPIPDSLKVQLVDDWENVTKHEMLVKLPKTPNVKEVLQMYRSWVVERKKLEKGTSTGSSSSSKAISTPLAVLDEVLSGLEVYFDKALGNNLLYRFERTQYLQVRKGASAIMSGRGPRTSSGGSSGSNSKSKRDVAAEEEEKQPSEIYGAEHLLRLFVNLPSIIAHTTLDTESVGILRDQLEEFLQFMVREKAKLFARYEHPSPAYQRLSGV